MRVVALTLVALHLLTACSARAPRPPLTGLRDGPVTVRAELLGDPETQRRHLGRPLEASLRARVLPVALALENVGTRDLVVVPSDLVFEAPFGERVPPLHADALAAVFADAVGEYEHVAPLERGRLYAYPGVDLSADIGSQICFATFFGCVLLIPPTLVGLALEGSRLVTDRVRNAEARAAVRAVQRRDDALATVDALVLAPGQTVRGIVYFPAVLSELPARRPPALVVRFTDRVTGTLAIVVRVDLTAAPSR